MSAAPATNGDAPAPKRNSTTSTPPRLSLGRGRRAAAGEGATVALALPRHPRSNDAVDPSPSAYAAALLDTLSPSLVEFAPVSEGIRRVGCTTITESSTQTRTSRSPTTSGPISWSRSTTTAAQWSGPRDQWRWNAGKGQWFLPGELFPQGTRPRGTIQGGGPNRAAVRKTDDFLPSKFGDAYAAGFTAESRVTDMDRYGWDKQVLIDNFPLPMRTITEGADQGLLWACTRAYNNWARSFADTAPSRLKMVGVMPDQHDIEGLVTEARRVVEKLGAVTVARPPPSQGQGMARPGVRLLLGPGRRAGLPHVLPRRPQRRAPRRHPLPAPPHGLRAGGRPGARPWASPSRTCSPWAT